ncbi:MAG: HPr family phosphocarrier protein [Acidobacteriota bacterium]
MIERVVRIQNELGLHARAAARLVRLASRFSSSVSLSRTHLQQQIDGKSILGLLLLAAAQGTELRIRVDGLDEEQAMESIVSLIEEKFGEKK